MTEANLSAQNRAARYCFRALIALLALIAWHPICSAQEEISVLVKGVRGDKIVYILPETHANLPEERGPYFRSRILPALKRAEIVAGELRDAVTLFPGNKSCDHAAEVPGIDRYVIRLMRRDPLSFRLKADESLVARFSLFDKFDAIYSWLLENYRVDLTPNQDSIASYSLSAGKKLISLETTADRASLFCHLALNDQIQMITEHIELAQRVEESLDLGKGYVKSGSPAELIAAYRSSILRVHCQLVAQHCIDQKNMARLDDEGDFALERRSEITNRFIIEMRTTLWVKRIEHELRKSNQVFVFIGSRHVPSQGGYKGIIELLGEIGFKFNIVE